jgi:hypothetical protein
MCWAGLSLEPEGSSAEGYGERAVQKRPAGSSTAISNGTWRREWPG